MAITLAQFKVGMANKIDHQVISIIQENSRLMDKLVYDDAVTAEGGSTLVYGYTQLKTAGKANGRAINGDYTPAAAEREIKTAQLAIMGGAYEIDRVLASNKPRFIDEITFQNEQLSKATKARFQYLIINGDVSTDATAFDGLDKVLASTANDFTGTTVDISGAMTQTKAEALAEALDVAIASVQDGADAILVNTKQYTKLVAAARLLGYLKHDETAFGKGVYTYNGIEIIDMGQYNNGTANVDIIAKDSSTSTAKMYIVNLSKAGLIAVTPQGGIGLSTHLPDFSTAGAVKRGDVEMVACAVLKNTSNAAVIKVKL